MVPTCLFENLIWNILKASTRLKRMPFYAVAAGRKTGIFSTWSECEAQVKGFSGCVHKSFKTEQEAKAFLASKTQNAKSGPTRNHHHRTIFDTIDLINNPPGPSRKISKRHSSNVQPSSPVIEILDEAPRNIPRKYASFIKPTLPTIEIRDEDDVPNETPKEEVSFEDCSQFDGELSRLMDGIEGEGAKKRTTKRKTILIDIPTDAKRPKSEDAKGAGPSKGSFSTDESGYVIAYTDGSCWKNGTKYARAGLGVYFGENHPLNASEPVSGRATNNCGEIQAATKAILAARSENVKKLAIHTDSQFVINAATKWMPGWKRKGWKLASGDPVKNEIDFKLLDQALELMDVRWVYVEAHRGILGNERADQFAKAGAALYKNEII